MHTNIVCFPIVIAIAVAGGSIIVIILIFIGCMLCALFYVWTKSSEKPKEESKWIGNEELFVINQPENGDTAVSPGGDHTADELKVDGNEPTCESKDTAMNTSTDNETTEATKEQVIGEEKKDDKENGQDNVTATVTVTDLEKMSTCQKNENTTNGEPKVNTFGQVIAEDKKDESEASATAFTPSVDSAISSDSQPITLEMSTFTPNPSADDKEVTTDDKEEKINSESHCKDSTISTEEVVTTSSNLVHEPVAPLEVPIANTGTKEAVQDSSHCTEAVTIKDT
jgi:hypothetical protein